MDVFTPNSFSTILNSSYHKHEFIFYCAPLPVLYDSKTMWFMCLDLQKTFGRSWTFVKISQGQTAWQDNWCLPSKHHQNLFLKRLPEHLPHANKTLMLKQWFFVIRERHFVTPMNFIRNFKKSGQNDYSTVVDNKFAEMDIFSTNI